MGIFFSFWRRIFGGYDDDFKILDKRGVQMILCVLAVFAYRLFITLAFGLICRKTRCVTVQQTGQSYSPV